MKTFRETAPRLHRTHAKSDDDHRRRYLDEEDELPGSMLGSPSFWLAGVVALLAWIGIALLWW